MAIIIIIKCFEIMALGSYLHLETPPTNVFQKNLNSKIDATFKKRPKCCKHIGICQFDHMATFFLLFKNPLKF
jgi:hypothetical protein